MLKPKKGVGCGKGFLHEIKKRINQILLPYRRRDSIYKVRARKKENKTNQAREWDRATREPDRATRESDNETKKAGQESEAVEHPLTFGYYVNIQIGNLRKERRKGWNWNE